jgi:hypothetical protein
MDKVCTFCGADDRYLELNHPFSKALEPGIMYYACKSDHRIFTAWQWADRVPLDKTVDEPPVEVKQQYMILATMRCTELVSHLNPSQTETATVVQSLARGCMTSYGTGVKVKSWEDGTFPRSKALNFANVPSPKLKPENIKYVHAAMAGIEAYLYEEQHGRKHPISILLRHFEDDPDVARLVFEKFDPEITALNHKNLLTQPKVMRGLAAKMSAAIVAELGRVAR